MKMMVRGGILIGKDNYTYTGRFEKGKLFERIGHPLIRIRQSYGGQSYGPKSGFSGYGRRVTESDVDLCFQE